MFDFPITRRVLIEIPREYVDMPSISIIMVQNDNCFLAHVKPTLKFVETKRDLFYRETSEYELDLESIFCAVFHLLTKITHYE